MVQSESVKCAYYNERDDETQHGLIECVPVHILRPIQVNHTHVHVLSGDDFSVYHDRDAQKEAAHPHQNINDDGPLNGPLFRCRMYNCDVPGKRNKKIMLIKEEIGLLFYINDTFVFLLF